MKYNQSIDKKWLKKWREENLYAYNPKGKGEKFYLLEMFSYPSGSTLHIGHWYNYAPLDTYSRFKRMKGYNVFHPMGFDAFGLPAENFAIQHGIHPHDSTASNIKTMRLQLEEMGGDYDWNYSLETHTEDYYKWTQWLFLKLYENNLAYKKEAPVNWCPSCNTVLANEQVKNGTCDRCESVVSKKKISQWFFKITDYAEDLINDLEDLDWPSSTKKTQLNWIGKSIGSEVSFKVKDQDIDIKVFTTRVDTLAGVTYVVLSPENDLVSKLTKENYQKEVDAYIKKTSTFSEIERMETDREKTGVFIGSYAINPITKEEVPIWISDYVLEGYGTGCVMAVPAHDTRDFEFATKFDLPIRQVIKNGDNDVLPMTEQGTLINSLGYNNLTSEDAKITITKDLEKDNKGQFMTNYRLKDWLVSRQRYWGSPIPIVYCDTCGIVPESYENLPVKLPYDVEFKPDGKSPLAKSEEFINCACPKCKGPAKREVDTLDTFVCSSWYFLRYPDVHNDKEAFNKDIVNKMLPVDLYIGGNEHAAMHLIYARFITKVLKDLGYLSFSEPFSKLRHQGMILGSDGNKMSKSKGNTVIPDQFIKEYGADIFRCYLMFGFSYLEGGPWKDEGISAMARYFSRIESFFERLNDIDREETTKVNDTEKKLLTVMNKTVLGIEEDLDKLQFNTAISKTMEFMNELVRYEQFAEPINKKLLKECASTFIKILAPFAPFFSEEMWKDSGNDTSIHLEKWPKVDKSLIEDEQVEIAVQVNGRLRATLPINKDAKEATVKELALDIENVKLHTQGKEIVKIIYVANKIINIVVK